MLGQFALPKVYLLPFVAVLLSKWPYFIEATSLLQTGFSGNMIVVTVLYSGGFMMSEAQMTVGDLTSFLLYTVYVGVSVAGE